MNYYVTNSDAGDICPANIGDSASLEKMLSKQDNSNILYKLESGEVHDNILSAMRSIIKKEVKDYIDSIGGEVKE